ncbi:hypothetical protein MAR_027455 [Mya arenaria]|uniref:Ig-like domain-containing protein n=1 Tax=Mya arenaria TaxID=6604 RepID=A0ABY7ETU6_MYAAR|nr:hypothetical protein MAR_027455 [Mya arenaria]
MWLYQMTLRLILFLITVNFTWTRTATLINLGQGRCGEETELVCSGTGTFTWNIRKDSIIVADPAQLHDDIKYSVSVTSTSVTLTIHNTDVSDLGEYSCEVAYDGRSQANATLASVTSGKRLQLTVDKLFPASVSAVLSVNAMVRGGGANTPGAPQLANSITEESKLILRVDEGKPATVSCTSSGFEEDLLQLFISRRRRRLKRTGRYLCYSSAVSAAVASVCFSGWRCSVG